MAYARITKTNRSTGKKTTTTEKLTPVSKKEYGTTARKTKSVMRKMPARAKISKMRGDTMY